MMLLDRRPRRKNVSDSVRVECYSGYTYAQEPRSFEWQGQRYQVGRIAKRWRTPFGPAFRVQVTGISDSPSPISNWVDLHYSDAEDKWTLTVHNSFEEDQR
jgi:hypothetical protein